MTYITDDETMPGAALGDTLAAVVLALLLGAFVWLACAVF
jgi:hypothetical protein